MISLHYRFLFTLFLFLIINCSAHCCADEKESAKKLEQETFKSTLSNGNNWKWYLRHRIKRQNNDETIFLADVSPRHAALHAKLTSIRPSSPNKKGDTLT